MIRIEHRTTDKSSWPIGPWQGEPDKIQWTDEETGLPCLIKRASISGHLCGYVGVLESHPIYRFTPNNKEIRKLKVHGGVNYSKGCEDLNDLWTIHQKYLSRAKEEAKTYPRGDAAQFLKEWENLLRDREKWTERAIATSICHIPQPGEPDDIWWLGFDCAHVSDRSPGTENLLGIWGQNDIYRDVEFVKRECESLARQLKALDRKP